MYQFQYILQQEQYYKRLQQKYNSSEKTLAGMQYLMVQGLVYNFTADQQKHYQKLSLIKQSQLYNMDLPYYPTGEYYAELHDNAFMMAIKLDAKQEFDWAANANSTGYRVYVSSRSLNELWNIKIIQFNLTDYPGEIFLQIAIAQNKNVTVVRLLSEDTGNMTLAYYLGYTQATYFSNAQLEDLINDIMFIVLERPANSDQYYYNGTDIIIDKCKSNYKLVDNICVCDDGYSLYNGECYLSCPSSCKTCTKEVCVLSSGKIICRDGYYMDEILKICLQCSNQCLTCKTYSSCISCPTGFILVDDKCITCQEYKNQNTNCQIYNDKCECIGCVTGFQLMYSNCIPCEITCKSCEFQNKCIICIDGYYLENGICKKCENHCYQCNSQFECFSCEFGYYIDTGRVYQCDKNCQTYGDNCICIGCPDQFYLSNLDCHNCLSPCLTCTTQDSCLTCISDSYYFDDQSQKCPLCQSPCLTCENSVKCKTCINDEYYLSNLKECVNCPSPMKQCYWEEKSISCTTCISTYYCFQRVCYHCPSYCKLECYVDKSGNTQCDDCIKGYYKSSPDIPFTCEKCPIGCSECLSKDKCISCLPDFILIDGVCKKCSEVYSVHCIDCDDTVCIKCESPYVIKDKDCYKDVPIVIPICPEKYQFYNAKNNTCDDCLKQCLTCIDAVSCTSCPDGYYLEKGLCVQCRLPCMQCTSYTFCTIAQSGYYIDNTISYGSINALKCVPPCLTCNSLSDCIICVDGYYLKDGQCVLCDTNCKTCKDISTTCISCPKGYQLVNQKCEKCIDDACQSCNEHCSTCNHLLDSLYVCFECLPGYLKQDQECIQCDIKCKTCIQTIDKCTSCPPHHYLTKDMICLPCDTGCDQCQIETRSCLVCEEGLQLVESTEFYYICIKCGLGCETCDQTHCLTCKAPDYYLDEGQCKKCETPCKTCTSKTQCITCVDGYYLDGESCIPCSDGCQSCTSGEECIICKFGYHLDGKVCQLCPENCTSCTSSTECITCKSGYFLNHLCFECGEHCTSCTKDTCISCETPFKLNEGKCSQDTLVCIANCKQCSNNTECIVCNDSYQLSMDSKSCDQTIIVNEQQESSSSSGFGVVIGIVAAIIPIGILAKYIIDRCRYDIRPRKPERKKQKLQDLIQTEPSMQVV